MSWREKNRHFIFRWKIIQEFVMYRSGQTEDLYLQLNCNKLKWTSKPTSYPWFTRSTSRTCPIRRKWNKRKLHNTPNSTATRSADKECKLLRQKHDLNPHSIRIYKQRLEMDTVVLELNQTCVLERHLHFLIRGPLSRSISKPTLLAVNPQAYLQLH